MKRKPLNFLFAQFLIDAGKQGYTLEEVTQHIKSFGFQLNIEAYKPKVSQVDITSEDQPEKDEWLISAINEQNNKRRTVLAAIRHLILEESVTVGEINGLGALVKSSRPILRPVEEITGDLVKRYFLKSKEVLDIDGVKYAVLHQWGGERFEQLVELLNERYHLGIKKAA